MCEGRFFCGGKSRFSAPSPKEIQGLQYIPVCVYTRAHVFNIHS